MCTSAPFFHLLPRFYPVVHRLHHSASRAFLRKQAGKDLLGTPLANTGNPHGMRFWVRGRPGAGSIVASPIDSGTRGRQPAAAGSPQNEGGTQCSDTDIPPSHRSPRMTRPGPWNRPATPRPHRNRTPTRPGRPSRRWIPLPRHRHRNRKPSRNARTGPTPDLPAGRTPARRGC